MTAARAPFADLGSFGVCFLATAHQTGGDLWNAGDGTCRILEIIAPGGFEQLFADIAADPEAMTGERAAALDARYGLDVDYASIERLCQEHGLRFPA